MKKSKEIPPRNVDALRRAFHRANGSLAVLAEDPSLLTAEKASEVAQLSSSELAGLLAKGSILALDLQDHGLRYPAWQFDQAVSGQRFLNVMHALRKEHAWSKYRFFIQRNPALGGDTPIDALSKGKNTEVIHAAEIWARGEQGGG